MEIILKFFPSSSKVIASQQVSSFICFVIVAFCTFHRWKSFRQKVFGPKKRRGSQRVTTEEHLLKLGRDVKGTLRLDVSEVPCLSCTLYQRMDDITLYGKLHRGRHRPIGIVEDDYIGKNWRCVWWKGLQLSDAFCCIDKAWVPCVSFRRLSHLWRYEHLSASEKWQRFVRTGQGHCMMKGWTFQDTSLRARRGSFAVLTNCHSRFSFSSVVWCFHAGLFWRHRQATSNASAATYWFAFTIATGVIKMGDPSWLIPTSQPSPFTNGRTTPHPSLTPTPFCAGGVGQSRAWSADNGPTGGHRCQCISMFFTCYATSFSQHPLLGCRSANAGCHCSLTCSGPASSTTAETFSTTTES